jgi:hypothetical protein
MKRQMSRFLEDTINSVAYTSDCEMCVKTYLANALMAKRFLALQRMWSYTDDCEPVAPNMGSIVDSVGPACLIVARIVGSWPVLVIVEREIHLARSDMSSGKDICCGVGTAPPPA